MRISTLITRLKEARDKYGDLPVKRDDAELGFLPVHSLGIDGIHNVNSRWSKRQLAVVNRGREKHGLPSLTGKEAEFHTKPRPIYKPKFIWL